MKNNDARVKIFIKKNGGLSDARNYGVTKSSGDYVFFLDGDDLIQDNTIEILYNLVKNNISMCNLEHFSEKTRFYREGVIQVFEPEEFFKSVLLLKNNTFACGVLIPRIFLDKSFFIKGRYFEDMACMGKVYSRCKKIIKIDSCLYKYRNNPNSIVHTVDEQKVRDRLRSASDFIECARKGCKISENYLDIYRCEAYKNCYIMSRDNHYLLEAKELSKKISVKDLSFKNKAKFLLLRNSFVYRTVLFLKQKMFDK